MLYILKAIFINALLIYPSFILFGISSVYIAIIPSLITEWFFKKSALLRLIAYIIEATILGCVIATVLICEEPIPNITSEYYAFGILIGYSIAVHKLLPITEYRKEMLVKGLNRELLRVPKKINKFVLSFGYKDSSYFEKYFNESSAFKRTRKFKGIPFTTEYGISTDIFSKTLQIYQARVNQDFQNHLSQLIPMLQVFGIDDLYELSPAFQDYYHVKSITEQISEQTQNVEDIVVEKQILFLQTMNPYEKLEKAANIVIVEMINQGLIEHIPQSGLYKSTKPDDFFSSKDVPGSLVEGTTSEISIYD